jgi:hypothetical protein
MRPPRQLQASYKWQLMRLIKPLYGITEAPSYWYDTYIPAFKALPTSMTQSFLDECLLFTVPPAAHSSMIADVQMKIKNSRLHGMAGILVDDALLTGNASFAAAEQAMHARFENTASTETEQSELAHAGATIIQSTPPDTVRIVQKTYIRNLAIPTQLDWNFAAIRTYRGRLS